MKTPDDFRAALVDYLARNGLAQSDLAKKARVSTRIIASITQGKLSQQILAGATRNRRIGLVATMTKIARFIGVDPAEAIAVFNINTSDIDQQTIEKKSPSLDAENIQPVLKCLAAQSRVTLIDLHRALDYARALRRITGQPIPDEDLERFVALFLGSNSKE